MVSLASRLRVVFVLMFLFVLGLPPVHAVDVDGLDFRVGVGSGVLEEQSYLDNNGEDFVDDDVENVDGVENNSENNIDVVGGLENENSNVGLDSENNNNNNNFDGGSGLVTENNNNNVVVGVDGFSGLGSVSGVPSVLGFSVSGDFDRSKTGVGFYRNVRVQVTGENFTGDNFLSKEGLHWSDKTRVEPITAHRLGTINDPVRFFPQNTPTVPVDAFSMNNGDSGRITFVGKTQSNIDLDIIWTVTSSDKNAWISGSGFNNDGKTKGLGFTGEQYMPNSNGNSIVVLYNQANTLGLHYKIVKHGTMEEVPVLVSFISTDIDAGQGVDTDLDNITRIVPPESNLKIDNNLVYDSTPGVVGLNGSNDLPKGGYIGVGFVSSFNYTFFSPAPRRANEYQYSSAVRYDIFGSSLQANVESRIIQNLSVEYKTIDGVELAEPRVTNGFVGDAITSEELTFDGYTLVEKKEDYSASSYPKITYVYKKDTKQVTPTKPNNPNNPTVPSKPTTPTKPTNPTKPTTPTKPPVTTKPSNPITQPVRPQTTTPPRTVTRVPQTYVPRTLSPHTPPRQSPHLQQSSFLVDAVSHNNDKGSKARLGFSVKDDPGIRRSSGKMPLPPIRFVRSREDNGDRGSFNVKRIPKPPMKIVPITERCKKGSVDYSQPNTGMTKKEWEQFKAFVTDVANKASKGGASIQSINKAVANAVAYRVYSGKFQQQLVNDFKIPEGIENFEGNGELMDSINKEEKYIVDFPHGGATMGSVYPSAWYHEFMKNFSGLSIANLRGVTPKDIFVQLNSRKGDELTKNSPKDLRTNMDSFVFLYHPSYKHTRLDINYIEYYENCNLKSGIREQFYNEVIDLKTQENPYYKDLFLAGATVSIGGIILVLQRKYPVKSSEYPSGLAGRDEGTGIFVAPKSFSQTWQDIKNRFSSLFSWGSYTTKGAITGSVLSIINPKVENKPGKKSVKVSNKKTNNKKAVIFTGITQAVKTHLVETNKYKKRMNTVLSKKDKINIRKNTESKAQLDSKKKNTNKNARNKSKVNKKKPKFNSRLWGWR